MAISSELERQLAQWLPRQSWFPRLDTELGEDPDVTPMSETRLFEIDTPAGDTVQALVAVIAVGEGKTLRRLGVPLVFRTAENYELRSHLIGTIDDMTLGRCWVYDACADPVFVLFMAASMARGKRFQGGQVQAVQVARGSDDYAELDSADALLDRAATTQLAVSNTRSGETIVFIDDIAYPSVLMFFRVLTPGMSSGVRIPVVLTTAGSQAVPPVVGWTAARWFDGRDLTTLTAPLAMLTRSEPGAQAAWRDAVDTVVEVDSGSIGSFNKRAAALGARMGELHADLAREFGHVDGDERLTKAWVRKWTERIDWALARAPLALSGLETQLRCHRDEVAQLDTVGSLQRIHGDLTLSHVMTGPTGGFTAVNFADSSAASGSEDSQSDPKPAAIDLVALLRSIDYAAGYARLRRTGALDVDARPSTLGVTGFDDGDDDLREVIDSPEHLWSGQAQNALLTGYSHAVDASVGVHDPVLRAVLVDRLLVEVVAELRNRPAWLIVPLSELTLLLGGRGSGVAGGGAGDGGRGEAGSGAGGASRSEAGGAGLGAAGGTGPGAGGAGADGDESAGDAGAAGSEQPAKSATAGDPQAAAVSGTAAQSADSVDDTQPDAKQPGSEAKDAELTDDLSASQSAAPRDTAATQTPNGKAWTGSGNPVTAEEFALSVEQSDPLGIEFEDDTSAAHEAGGEQTDESSGSHSHLHPEAAEPEFIATGSAEDAEAARAQADPGPEQPDPAPGEPAHQGAEDLGDGTEQDADDQDVPTGRVPADEPATEDSAELDPDDDGSDDDGEAPFAPKSARPS